MEKKFVRTQTHDTESNLAWKIVYSVLENGEWINGCRHDNFAEDVGRALLAFHHWMQCRMHVGIDGYKITEVYRLLRANHNGERIPVAEVKQDDWPSSNPLVVREKKREGDALTDETEPFSFLSQVPVVEKK